MDYFNKSKERTYYDVLEVEDDCSSKDIKEAFIKLSKECHPDTCDENTENAHEKFIRLNEAYSVLSKDRAKYDEFLKVKKMEAKFGGDKVTNAAHEHYQKHGFAKGPDPRKYSHFYSYYNVKDYKYDPPLPNATEAILKKKILMGLSLAVIILVAGSHYISKKIAYEGQANSRKKSEINSIMYSHSQNLAKLYGNETFNKLLNKEIKNMTLAEATEEYERRQRERRQK